MSNLERAHAINGVLGRMFASHVRDAAKGTFGTQTWKASRTDGVTRTVVELRYDDNCGNGHNTFSATCTIYENGRDVGGGAAHDHIAKVFPELAPLLKWHLVSSDGPMHCVANAVYLAGDRDCWGLRAGETRQIRNGKTKQLCWQLSEHSLPKYVDSDTQPPGTATLQYVPWLRTGEGKARELDAARSVAVWPEATDAELTAPDLRERLEARLQDCCANSARLSSLPDSNTLHRSDY